MFCKLQIFKFKEIENLPIALSGNYPVLFDREKI